MPQLASWVDFAFYWAPSASAVDGGYVIWYTARDHASGRQCISRATSAAPGGPYVDELSAPAICQADLGGSIDPHLFTDVDGTRYLYWKSDENALGNPSRIWVAAVSADGRTLTSTPTALLNQDAPWEAPTMEQPAVVHVGATYYLFYSGGWWESDTYAIGYATAASPLGPFTKQTASTPWVASTGGALGPGALDVFNGPGGALWATYHAWPGTPSYAAGGSRTTRLAELRF
jgi:beta-xylosidase